MEKLTLDVESLKKIKMWLNQQLIGLELIFEIRNKNMTKLFHEINFQKE